MRRRFLFVPLVIVLALGMSTVALAARDGVKRYEAAMQPLNDGSNPGWAALALDQDQLTVSVDVSGLDNVLHLQHIHGHLDSRESAMCPTSAADANDDGLVDLLEGLPDYGPILMNLDPFPAGDTIDFTNTYTIARQDLMPLQNRHVVIHGVDVDGNGMLNGIDVDGDGDVEGFLEENFELTMPASCGEIEIVPGN